MQGGRGGGGGGAHNDNNAAAEGPTGLKKGPWTAEEDAVLVEHVRKHGEGNWNSVQRLSGLSRCGKSCRLRWANHLRPNLRKGQLTPEEELLVLRLHAQLGNKWARMAAHLPGRTDNEIKNYWNTRVKRRQRAGLPLYPPGILQRHRPPPLALPSAAPPAFASPLAAYASSPDLHASSPDLHRAAKRARDDGTVFWIPASPAGPSSVTPRMWHTAPSTPTGTTMFDYNIMPPLTPMSSTYCAAMGMLPNYPSTNHVLDGDGGMELMDKLLQEAERVDGRGADPVTNMSVSNMFEMNTGTNNNMSVSDLFEMIPAQPPPMTQDWNNSDGSDVISNGTMSNGTQSALTNDDLSVDLHQLSASLPIELEWSCHWNNNMPELA